MTGSKGMKKAFDELFEISLSLKTENPQRIEQETAKNLYERNTRLLSDYGYFKE
jgi:hypothetical protein